MPCASTIRRPFMTEERYQQAIDEALADLRAALLTGQATVTIDAATGAVALDNWNLASRRGMTDVCAVQRLMVENSWEWQQAVASAEVMAGRSLNTAAVESGVHRHGSSWHPGH